MIALVLAVSCGLAIGMIFKHTGRQGIDRIALLTVNYLVAVVVAGLFLELGGREISGGLNIEPGLLALGFATGALFIFGFFMLSLATDVAGMSLAIGVMRVSVVIPFLASWVIWSEVPTMWQGAGLILASGAFFMISHRERRPAAEQVEAESKVAVQPAPASAARSAEVTASAEREAETASAGKNGAKSSNTNGSSGSKKWYVFGILALLFLSGGAVDTSMKAFDELFAAENSRALFMLMVFGVAFLIGAVIVGWRRATGGSWPLKATVLWGTILGVVNYGSVEFLLQAIEQLSGPFVFPANSISIVIGGALLGVYFWGERLSRLNWIGLMAAAVALFLLNL